MPQAAIPPPQMTMDDTNSRRNHKALSDYKHNESLTYYCWLNSAMGKVDRPVSQEFSRCFISRACLHFTGLARGLFFFSVYSSGSFLPSHDNFEVSTRVLVLLLHSFPASVCAAILRNINVHPPPPPSPCSCAFDKNLPGLFFPPCRQPLTISCSAFSSLHFVMRALNKTRSAWTLTRAFACANTRADIMRMRTPSNMVPIMCLSFSKLEQYSTVTNECFAHGGILQAVCTGK